MVRATKHFMNTLTTLIGWSSITGIALGAELKDYPVQPVPLTAVQVIDSFWPPFAA